MDSFVITVRSDNGLPNASWGSVSHGVLVDLLPAPFPDLLHDESVRPLSQWIQPKGAQEFEWHINTLDASLADAVSMSLKPEQRVACRHLNCDWHIVQLRHERMEPADYLKHIYLCDQAARGVSIRFCTPTTHKSGGRYVTFPSVELIGHSLRNRMTGTLPDLAFEDETVFNQIYEHSYISRYELHSCTYALEGHYVPAYIGRLEVHFKGPDPLRRLAETLYLFGNWSGIGIKTALGMGGCEIRRIEEGKRNGR